MHSHQITRCSNCNTVISQCRCMSKDKTVVYELCSDCKDSTIDDSQQRRTTYKLNRNPAPVYVMEGVPNPPRIYMTEVDFMDLKKGDVFLMMEPEGVKVQNTFVTNKDGIWKFRATGSPYMKDFGKGPVGAIESEPLTEKEMEFYTIGVEV